MEQLPQRKPNRLKYYDYNRNGAYFITICTHQRKQILSNIVGATIGRPQGIKLTSYGIVVDRAIRRIPDHYPMITVDHYVIMPNHIHLLIYIHSHVDGRPLVAPTISTVIQQMKGYVTKQIGVSIWQKLFHDHVIRDREDYIKIAEYIRDNPKCWQFDRFYGEGND